MWCGISHSKAGENIETKLMEVLRVKLECGVDDFSDDIMRLVKLTKGYATDPKGEIIFNYIVKAAIKKFDQKRNVHSRRFFSSTSIFAVL